MLLKVINSQTVVKLTKTAKLCNSLESLQVGGFAGLISPWLAGGSKKEGVGRRDLSEEFHLYYGSEHGFV